MAAPDLAKMLEPILDLLADSVLEVDEVTIRHDLERETDVLRGHFIGILRTSRRQWQRRSCRLRAAGHGQPVRRAQ
jgi:hypothetical protein